ncbi:MAG: AEC family transporter [Lachnospiraceae bacterium]|nr:AEC family transporter [Lachnospiraceae bacterium]MBP5185025.1 AEC family transporter [Lachnospiraceae bacterium]
MLDNLIFSMNTVLPLLLLMAVGMLCRKLNMFDSKFVSKGNNLVFRVFLPVMICKNVMGASAVDASAMKVFLFVVISVSSLFLILFVIIPFIEKDDRKRGVMIQAIGRSNYALFGIPLVSLLFPGQDVSIASILVLATVPLFNVYSTIALEVYNLPDHLREKQNGEAEKQRRKAAALHILKGILLNPLIIASVLGFILFRLHVTFPSPVQKTIDNLSGVATPLALFLLGGSFEFSKIHGNLKQLIICVTGKLILSPLVFVTLAAVLGFKGPALGAILITFASPAAASSFPMAQQMGGDAELAAEHIVFSSAFSVLTVFLAIFILKTLGLI